MRKFIISFLFTLLIFLSFGSISYAENNKSYKVSEDICWAGGDADINNHGEIVSLDFFGNRPIAYQPDPGSYVPEGWWVTSIWDKDGKRAIGNWVGERSGGAADNGTVNINDYSAVIASAENGYHYFYWNKEIGVTNIDFGTEVHFNDINTSGKVIGSKPFYGSPPHAFASDVFSINGTKDLGVLSGEIYSSAIAINDSGTIVGSSGNHAFIWDKDTGMTDIGEFRTRDINNSGVVVGSNGKAVVWDKNNGLMEIEPISLAPYKYNYTGKGAAVAINDDGTVVGYWQMLDPENEISGYTEHAFIWNKDSGAVYLDDITDYEGYAGLRYVIDINNSGQILAVSGEFFDSFENWVNSRIVLLNPTVAPEPVSMFLFSIGGITLMLFRRKQL
jgi:hypothetical protein